VNRKKLIAKKAEAIVKCYIDSFAACIKIIADDSLTGLAKGVLIQQQKAMADVQARLIQHYIGDKCTNIKDFVCDR
jgi:hypothetical protein